MPEITAGRKRETDEEAAAGRREVACHYCGTEEPVEYMFRHKAYRRTWFCAKHKGFITAFTVR